MPTDAEAMARADPASRDLALNTALEAAYGAQKDVQFGNLAEQRAEAETETNGTLRSAADAYFQRAATALHDGDAGESAENTRKFRAALDARTDLAADEKDRIRLDFELMAATRTVMGEADRARKAEGFDAAGRVVDDFARGGGPAVADGQREPVLRVLRAHLADGQAAERTAQAEAAAKAKRESAKRLAAVEKSIGEGQYGLEDLERDAQAGMFEGFDDAPGRLSGAIETARMDRQAKADAAARGAEAIAAGTPLDPADPQHVSAIDAWWEADPDKGPAGAIEAARRTGILPGPARDAIADGLLYGTPEKRAEQARALVDLIKAAPAAAETLPPELRQEAARIAKRIEQGHDPASATAGTDKALEGVSGSGLDKSIRRSELERDKFDEVEATSKAMAENRGRVVPTQDSENAPSGADPRGDNGGAGGGGDSDAVLNLGAVKVRLSKSEERKLSDRMLRDIEDHPKDELGWPAGLGKEHLRSNAEHNFSVLFDKALRETGDKEAAYKQALKDLKDTWTKGGDGLLVPAGTISGRIQDQDYQPLYAQTRLESVDPGADAFLRDYLHASDEEIFNEAHRYGLDPDLVLLCRAVVTGTIQTPAEVDELVGRFRPFVGRDQLENTLKTIAGRGTEAQRLKTLNGEETKYLRDAYRKRVGGSDFAANVVDAGVDAVGGIRAAGKIAKEIASPTLKNFKDALPSLQKIKEIMGW